MDFVDIIRRLESRRTSAMVAGDVDELRKLLDERLIYIHSNGRIEDRESLLRSISDGSRRYFEIDTSDQKIVANESSAFVLQKVRIIASLHGAERIVETIAVSAWINATQAWRAISIQATPFSG